MLRVRYQYFDNDDDIFGPELVPPEFLRSYLLSGALRVVLSCGLYQICTMFTTSVSFLHSFFFSLYVHI
jgi:hypothetical protein